MNRRSTTLLDSDVSDLPPNHGDSAVENCVISGTNRNDTQVGCNSEVVARKPVLSKFRRQQQPQRPSEDHHTRQIRSTNHPDADENVSSAPKIDGEIHQSAVEERLVRATRSGDVELYQLSDMNTTLAYNVVDDATTKLTEERCSWRPTDTIQRIPVSGSMSHSPTSDGRPLMSSSNIKPRMVVKPNLESSSLSSLTSSSTIHWTTGDNDERNIVSNDGVVHHPLHQRTDIELHHIVADEGCTSCITDSPTSAALRRAIQMREQHCSEAWQDSLSGTLTWSEMRLRGLVPERNIVEAQLNVEMDETLTCQQGSVNHVSMNSNSSALKKTLSGHHIELTPTFSSANVELFHPKYSPYALTTLPRSAKMVHQTELSGGNGVGNGGYQTVVEYRTSQLPPQICCSCDVTADVIRRNATPTASIRRFRKSNSGNVTMNDGTEVRHRIESEKNILNRTVVPTRNFGGSLGHEETTASRVLMSLLVAFFAGLLVFCATRYQLRYGLPVACCMSAAGTSAFGLVAGVSRRFRCISALAAPSAATTSGGRIGLVLLGFGCLMAGPVFDITLNVREMSRAMTCTADVAYNNTILLMQPFDSLMDRVHETLAELDTAVGDVERGLDQLDSGLGSVEQDVENGRLQLYSTGKTCRLLIERAFNQCTFGIQSARDQCLGVIGALGTVYHHARHILDSINPDRWAPKQQLHQQVLPNQRRRPWPVGGASATDEREEQTVELPDGDDSDICEPLSTTSVCQSLNDSQTLCQPSRWAGDAIQDAINATQSAMRSLRSSIHVKPPLPSHSILRSLSSLSSSSSSSSSSISPSTSRYRRNASNQDSQPVSTDGNFTVSVNDKSKATEYYLRLSSTILAQLIFLVGVMFILRSSSVHLYRYRSSDSYANRYFSSAYFRYLDERFRKAVPLPPTAYSPYGPTLAALPVLLPVRSHERQYVADVDHWTLSGFEHQLQRQRLVSGVTIACVQFLITSVCLGFDLLVAMVLNIVSAHGQPHSDVTVVQPSHNEQRTDVNSAFFIRHSGDGGLLGELLNTVMDVWPSRSQSLSNAADPTACIPVSTRRSLTYSTAVLLPLTVLHLLLILGVVLRARFMRMRDRISGYYYPRRAEERKVVLYRLIESRRRRLPNLLRAVARRNYVRNNHKLYGSQHPKPAIFVMASVHTTSEELNGTFRRLLTRCCCRRPGELRGNASCIVCGERETRNASLFWCRKQLLPIHGSVFPFPSHFSTHVSTTAAVTSSSSLMASAAVTSSSSEIPLQFCPGAFCLDCWNDLDRLCPLCNECFDRCDRQHILDYFDCIGSDDEDDDVLQRHGTADGVYL